MPVLVAVGEHDVITTPTETAAFATTFGSAPFGNARHVVISGAGHMPPMEKPAEFVDVLGAFWDELD